MSTTIDWNKIKSMVATSEGLEVTFEQDDGTLGAFLKPSSAQQTAKRQQAQLPGARQLPVDESPGEATIYTLALSHRIELWSGLVLPGMRIQIQQVGSKVTVAINRRFLAFEGEVKGGMRVDVFTKPAPTS